MMRLAIIHSHPIQYYVPLYRELAKLDGVDVRVYFCCDWGLEEYVDPGFGTAVKWDIPLLDGYDHEFLPIARRPRKLSFWEVDNPRVGEALGRFGPDVVAISGYARRTNWRAVAWARRGGRVVLMASDSNLRSKRAWWRQAIKHMVVRRFYDRLDGALFMNDNNRDYHQFYGIPEDRLFPAAMPIDRARLLGAVADRDETRREVRRRHGIPDEAFVVVQCGKYSWRKRPLDVAEACWRAHRRGLPVWSLLVGDGPDRAALEAYREREGVTNMVLTGFVNQSAIAHYYAASDALALASVYEPHGVVVAEGASFGLPVVASDLVGCVGPGGVARPGVNAIAYPCGDVGRMASAIERLFSDRDLYARMSAASAAVSVGQDAVATAEDYARAAEAVARLGPRRGDATRLR